MSRVQISEGDLQFNAVHNRMQDVPPAQQIEVLSRELMSLIGLIGRSSSHLCGLWQWFNVHFPEQSRAWIGGLPAGQASLIQASMNREQVFRRKAARVSAVWSTWDWTIPGASSYTPEFYSEKNLGALEKLVEVERDGDVAVRRLGAEVKLRLRGGRVVGPNQRVSKARFLEPQDVERVTAEIVAEKKRRATMQPTVEDEEEEEEEFSIEIGRGNASPLPDRESSLGLEMTLTETDATPPIAPVGCSGDNGDVVTGHTSAGEPSRKRKGITSHHGQRPKPSSASAARPTPPAEYSGEDPVELLARLKTAIHAKYEHESEHGSAEAAAAIAAYEKRVCALREPSIWH